MTAYIATPLQVTTPWKPGATFTIGAYFELPAATAFASGDTITWQNAVTPSGITAIEVLVYTTQLDSNATPTLVYKFGDTVPNDTNGPARYISGGKTGTNVAGQQVVTYSNVAPAFTAGVQTVGVGFTYGTDENSNSAEANGFNDLVLNFTAGPATGATTGTVWMYFTYYCVGVA